MQQSSERDSLRERFGLSGAVTFETSPFDSTAAVLTAKGSRVILELKGARVFSFVPEGQSELLWLSSAPRIDPARSPRGGIPVCWPWFGRHATDANKPAHGFVRGAPWSVLETSADENAARISLGFETRPENAALWPHSARVRLDVTVSRELHMDLITENTGAEPFPLTQALHTYLAISDVADVTVEGLDGRSYMDHVGALARREQQGPILLDREVDRVFDRSDDTVIIGDRGFGRRIAIAKHGSRATIVWNPWIEKGQRLGDMGPEGYRRMVCVETANAGDDVVTLAPGASHRLSANVGCGSR